MAGPITSWEIDGETVETVTDFIFGGSKITAEGDCSHEIKRRLLLGRKVMTNLDSAGVQPQLIQGIRSGDGVGDLFNYLFIKDIKSNRMRIAQ